MSDLKTRKTGANVREFLDAIQDPQRRASEIQSTLSFRLLGVIKSTVVYRLWARLRYCEYLDPWRQRP